jgi:protoheme IX farnesyltransferase
MIKQTPFSKFAWLTLGYNILVVLWGAFVRATGSGAGCGSHWPSCNGEVIPRAPQVETVIEFTHRITSGVSLVLVLVLVVWAFRAYAKGSPARLGALLSVVFIVLEALVGAGLVLFGWVAGDTSPERVVVMAIHLVNTFLLLAVLALTAWWAAGGQPIRLQGQGKRLVIVLIGMLATLVVGVSGAITALGDTLFPAGSTEQVLLESINPAAHFLIRLRPYHPLLAIMTGIVLAFTGLGYGLARPGSSLARLGAVVALLAGVQLLAGLINIVLKAPVWMQLLHLGLADGVWIAFVLFSAALLGQSPGNAAVLPVELASQTTSQG